MLNILAVCSITNLGQKSCVVLVERATGADVTDLAIFDQWIQFPDGCDCVERKNLAMNDLMRTAAPARTCRFI